MKHLLIKHQFPLVLISSVLAVVLFYQFSYLLPFTNNAFIVANITPVAANVSGYVTEIYVQNEEKVSKGQPLFQVFRTPYELAYLKAKNNLEEARAYLVVLDKKVEKTKLRIQAQQQIYERTRYDYIHNRSAAYGNAVAKITVHTALKEKDTEFKTLQALHKELEINLEQIVVQEKKIKALDAVCKNARVNLNETTVYALHDGAIQNMFSALGAPVKVRTPLFSLVDTKTLFVQANFYETDLRRVRPGHHVSIIPRIYLGAKVYHGIILSQNWSASRLDTHNSSQLQVLKNTESNWFLLPQRLPVQIKITDYEPDHYPLNIGESAYVYVHTDN
jgi:multidrug resistance efflux pump